MKSEQKRGMQKDAMKISQNTYMLETTRQAYPWKGRECYSMVYAVLEPDGITLIDTGFPDRGMEILNEVRELGKRKIDIKQIFLTHSDLDHMGNAAWIQDKVGCPVWVRKQVGDDIMDQFLAAVDQVTGK